MNKTLGFSILDLPGPSLYIGDILGFIDGGGCFANGYRFLCKATNGKNIFENFIKEKIRDLGYSVEFINAEGDDLKTVLSDFYKKPLHIIAKDNDLFHQLTVVFLNNNSEEISSKKNFEHFNTFFNNRHENGLRLLVFNEDNISSDLEFTCPVVQWSGFKRIDKMIWALKHLRSDGLLGNFAEALAVEIGNQDFDIIKRIASASRDQLERPVNFVEDIFPSESKMDLEKNIWKAQVRVFLPWIEEWRQIFIEKYKRKLVIDEHQIFLGVENVEDIEIGGIRHQLVKKGFLANIERDLIIALTKIRQKIAHGKVCNHNDFISARQKSITLGVND